jgi:hypothetical protein
MPQATLQLKIWMQFKHIVHMLVSLSITLSHRKFQICSKTQYKIQIISYQRALKTGLEDGRPWNWLIFSLPWVYLVISPGRRSKGS